MRFLTENEQTILNTLFYDGRTYSMYSWQALFLVSLISVTMREAVDIAKSETVHSWEIATENRMFPSGRVFANITVFDSPDGIVFYPEC